MEGTLVDDERRRIRSPAQPNAKEPGKHATTLQCLPSTSRVPKGTLFPPFRVSIHHPMGRPIPSRSRSVRFTFCLATSWIAPFHKVVASIHLPTPRSPWLVTDVPHIQKLFDVHNGRHHPMQFLDAVRKGMSIFPVRVTAHTPCMQLRQDMLPTCRQETMPIIPSNKCAYPRSRMRKGGAFSFIIRYCPPSR